MVSAAYTLNSRDFTANIPPRPLRCKNGTATARFRGDSGSNCERGKYTRRNVGRGNLRRSENPIALFRRRYCRLGRARSRLDRLRGGLVYGEFALLCDRAASKGALPLDRFLGRRAEERLIFLSRTTGNPRDTRRIDG